MKIWHKLTTTIVAFSGLVSTAYAKILILNIAQII